MASADDVVAAMCERYASAVNANDSAAYAKLFIAELAFGADPLGDAARVGILVGSVVAGTIGYVILRATLPPSQ
jgi:hypothetical protein